MQSFKRWIKELNAFENEESRHSPLQQRIAIMSTRFYLTILTLSISVIIVHTALGTQTKTNLVENPSYSIYLDLYQHHGNSMTCSCRTISISYRSFVSVSHQYHPVCSSGFVSETWLNLLFNVNMSYFFPVDFRSSAFGQFQLLASICSLLKRFVDDALNSFYSNNLLTTDIYSVSTLHAQSVSQASFTYNSIVDETQRLFKMIRRATYSNRLQTAMQTTRLMSLYIFSDWSVLSSLQGGLWRNRSGDLCVCDSNPTCSTTSGFFNLFAYESEGLYVPLHPYLGVVTGFVAGCYAFESLLQSNLECLFDHECLALVDSYFPSNNRTSFDPISINATRFLPTNTINTLLNELFLEYWTINTSFQDYFIACNPILCSYTSEQNSSFLLVLTTLLGLYGGLTVALRLIIPSIIGWWFQRTQTQVTTDSERSIIKKLRSMFKNLNIFKTARTVPDEFERRTQIIATRVFLFSLILCTIIIAVYNISITRTHLITIKNPSLTVYERLYGTYAETLECQCNNIETTYDKFLSISPNYHPVCSSLLISDFWMNSITDTSVADFTYDIQDFHLFGNTFFSTLSMLCSLAATTILDAWYIFKQFTLVSYELLSKDELTIRSRSAIDQFQSKTLTQFVSALDLIQMQTSNALSTIQGNVYLATYDRANNASKRIDFHWVPREWNNCSCLLNDACTASVGFFTYPPSFPWEDYTVKFYIPRFFLSCSAIQSILQSSLVCFFDQSCLYDILSELNSNISVTRLILHRNDTKFPPESSIRTVVYALMVEHWNDIMRYEDYYAQCRPKFCTYRVVSRDDFLYVVSILIGLFGGLTAALRLIIPTFVSLIRNHYRQENTNTPATNRSIRQWIKIKILDLNVFDTEDTWFDPRRRFEAIVATRVYFILLVMVLIILTFYNLLTSRIQNITIDNPSQSLFEELADNNLYASTLKCHCQNIAIPYGSFITISPHFHQYCSSDFLIKHTEWIKLLYYPWVAFFYPYTDFRLFAAIQFRLLASFCHITNATVVDALNRFLSSTLIHTQVQTRLILESQASVAIEHFRQSTAVAFTKIFDSIRQIKHGNGIISATLSNWHFLSLNTSTSWTALWSEPRHYGQCFCGRFSNCTSLAYIDQRLVRGFLVGCDPLESLLQSTLACLYDITCIFTIKYMYIAANITMRALNRSISDPNVTVQSLLEKLMVDRWETSINYRKYYQVCAPLFCSYSLTIRPNLLFVITTIISLFGGLNVALKVMVPKSVKLTLHIFNRQTNRVHPSILSNNNL